MTENIDLFVESIGTWSGPLVMSVAVLMVVGVSAALKWARNQVLLRLRRRSIKLMIDEQARGLGDQRISLKPIRFENNHAVTCRPGHVEYPHVGEVWNRR